jgi:uncharacterized protein YbbC (DUF1343 family)
MTPVNTGLDQLAQSPPEWVLGKRLGLLCNPASIDRHFRHARELIAEKLPGQLQVLFSPQHGFHAEKQDNMVESDHMIDSVLNIPVFSLYGQTRIPTKEMLASIDILMVDLQDAGTRVYTFIYTMAHCMEAAKRYGKKVLVLDRPNPINGTATEGNCLASDCISFVGRYPIPMRHGLTIGELALLFNNEYGIACDLEIIPMKNWKRSMFFRDTGLPWVPPSPNLPTPETAIVYPGQVLWEGTNVSEGRGTSQPFEIFGAPFVNTDLVLAALGGNQISGALLRPIIFEPTSNKWKNTPCKGFQIHVTDRYTFKPYLTTLKLLQTIRLHHQHAFEWKRPPYEYEYSKKPIDLIIGDKDIRRRVENLENIEVTEAFWQKDLDDFKKTSQKYHLYN